MTYQNVWWYPNYIEYGAGHNAPKTWPQVQEQYRRPHALSDLRHYEIPTEDYPNKLYYNTNLPRLAKPVYRGTFRDKPHTVARHYPSEDPRGKPVGFYGRNYYEQGPPQFKYDGPPKDELYWLEKPPYMPSFPPSRDPRSVGGELDAVRVMNPAPAAVASMLDANRRSAERSATFSQLPRSAPVQATRPGPNLSNIDPFPNYKTTYDTDYNGNRSKRLTLDGVGYL